MSDLLGSLSMAARALAAQTTGLSVVGQNVANVNTPGYARRVVDLGSVAPADRWSAGGGVEVTGIRSERDLLLEARLQQGVSAQSEQSALASGLAPVDSAIGTPGSSLDANLTAFFDAFSQLANDPTNAATRQGVLSQAASLTAAFHDMAGQIGAARTDADSGIRSAVDQVNALAQQIASLNASCASAGGSSGSTEQLQYRDEQLQAIQSLSALIGVHTIQRDDGELDVTFGNGRALVVGATAVPLQTAARADGTVALSSQGVDVTAEATGGQIGGLRQLRDVLAPDYLAKLDTLASSVAQQVNSLHQAGFDLKGQAGLPFFTPLAGVTGAASAITVNAALAADPSLVAAAGVASAGDNQTARAIAALRDAKTFADGTSTAAESFGTLAYQVGQDTATAKQQQQNCADAVLQITNLRESVSGVSLDEEAAQMMKFQRAYEANARYFQSVDSALDVLMAMVTAATS